MPSTKRRLKLLSAAAGFAVLLGGCGLSAGGPAGGGARSPSHSGTHASGTHKGATGTAKHSSKRTAKSGSAHTSTGAAAGTLPWMTYSTYAHTATLKLVAGYNSELGGLNYNGYGRGKMVVSVPTGWKVTVDFSNQGRLPHSVAITHSARSTAPAFPGAALPPSELTAGIAPGRSAAFTFTTGTPGTYRIACLVPGHQSAGMWDTFMVTGPSVTPSVKT